MPVIYNVRRYGGTGLALLTAKGGSPMATSLAYVFQETEPQLPLLSDEIPADPQSQLQREVQANLHNEINFVTTKIADPELREISQTILGEMLRFFDWLTRIENNLQKLDTLLESLSLLEVLEFDARSLTDFIDTKAIKLTPETRDYTRSWTAFPTELLTICEGFSNVSWFAE